MWGFVRSDSCTAYPCKCLPSFESMLQCLFKPTGMLLASLLLLVLSYRKGAMADVQDWICCNADKPL